MGMDLSALARGLQVRSCNFVWNKDGNRAPVDRKSVASLHDTSFHATNMQEMTQIHKIMRGIRYGRQPDLFSQGGNAQN